LKKLMNNSETSLWLGVSEAARNALTARDYKAGSLAQRIAYSGIDASELAAADRSRPEVKRAWIPGVEIFPRKIHSQRHRGVFGEFVRRDEGILARVGLWPKQWSAARMFAYTAKGFHVHPPTIAEGSAAADWLRRLFVDEPENYSLRRYDDEQWDVMFFLQGRVEMILCDIRAGLPRRVMRFFIDGDNHRSHNNVGVVIPAGVAHALRAEGGEDVMMVYGTSTIFQPEFEGRIASDVESAELPASWQKFLGRGGALR
jgi:dTDP-4-dehydrorhamnose 3,5-epimerase-like enzyme